MANSNQSRPYEKENYPTSLEIIYYSDQKFNYTIIQESIYLPAAKLYYTEAPIYFPIPDNYIIQTTWDRAIVSVQSPFDAFVELHR
ncbi:2847_t:CDS:2, partial [Funneliformis geosporum]